MAFYLESDGHTRTIVNGKTINKRSYEAVSAPEIGTTVLLKENGRKYLIQDNPILNVPANPKSLISRLTSDFKLKNNHTRRHHARGRRRRGKRSRTTVKKKRKSKH